MDISLRRARAVAQVINDNGVPEDESSVRSRVPAAVPGWQAR